MGKGRRTAAVAARVEAEEAVLGGRSVGGHGRGRGKALPVTSKAKKSRSVDELMGVDQLQIPSIGRLGELEVGAAILGGAAHSFSSSSSASSSSANGGAGIFKEVEERGVFADVVEEEEEDVEEDDDDEDDEDNNLTGRDGRGLIVGRTEHRRETVAPPVVEVIYTPVRGIPAAAVQGRAAGRAKEAETRCSERLGADPRKKLDAQYVLDEMPHPKGCNAGAMVRAQSLEGDQRGSIGAAGCNMPAERLGVARGDDRVDRGQREAMAADKASEMVQLAGQETGIGRGDWALEEGGGDVGMDPKNGDFDRAHNMR